MKVVINQSNYLPWKGYFDLIHDADLFIFHDDLQYTKGDWRNRNRLKTARGLEWLTVPVGTSEHRLICEVPLPATDWAFAHWRVIERHYAKASFFARYAPLIRETLTDPGLRTLSDLNQALITRIARDVLGIKTSFADSRSYGLTERKQARVLQLLQAAGATTYISGPAAQDYLEQSAFAEAGLTLLWKDYRGYPEYPQFHPPFEHAVSILDLIFHTGPDAPHYIWGWRDRL